MSKGYVLVTGASRGLGAATLIQLAKDGYDVVGTYVSDSSEAKIKAVVEEARAYGGKVEYTRCDIRDYDDCVKLFEFADQVMGKEIYALVANAGIAGNCFFHEEPRESYEAMIHTNLVAPMYCAQLALQRMLPQKDGQIVLLSSIGGTMGAPTQVAYGAAKGGLISFAKALSKEVSAYNIRVNCVAPGVMDTDMVAGAPPDARAMTIAAIPLGRMGVAQDIADCVSYIVNSNYVTGQTISPNGGIYA